jgi:hypothetical protein
MCSLQLCIPLYYPNPGNATTHALPRRSNMPRRSHFSVSGDCSAKLPILVKVVKLAGKVAEATPVPYLKDILGMTSHLVEIAQVRPRAGVVVPRALICRVLFSVSKMLGMIASIWREWQPNLP